MKSLGKRVISMILVLITFVGIFISSISSAYADSNDRIATYIKLAKDGEITDGNVNSMTEDQLRFLGIYLSNFYVPFGTEIGTSNGEIMEETKKDMVDTLQQKFAFSDELATSIVETVFGYTRSSLKELFFYVTDKNGTQMKLFDSCSYYDYFMIMSGRIDAYFGDILKNQEGLTTDGTPDGSGKYKKEDCYNYGNNIKIKGFEGEIFPKEVVDSFVHDFYGVDNLEKLSEQARYCAINWYKIRCGAYETISVGYCDDEGNWIKVGDAATKQLCTSEGGKAPIANDSMAGSMEYTPSQLAFFKSLEATAGLDKGYGVSFMDLTTKDTSLSELNQLAKEKKLSKEEAFRMTIFSSKMMIDCFGDIIRFGENHKVVVTPACLNPFVWQPVDGQGNDKGEAGSVFNMVNAICMSQVSISASKGKNVLIKDVGDESPLKDMLNAGGKFTLNFEVLNKSLEEMAAGGFGVIGHGNGYIFARIISGSSEANVDGNIPDYYRLMKDSVEGEAFTWGTGWQAMWNSISNIAYAAPRSNTGNSSNHFVGVEHDSYIDLLKNVVFIDNLGAYVKPDGSTEDFSAFTPASFIASNGTVEGDNKKVTFGKTNFGSLFENIKEGKMDVPFSASEQALCTLYVTYCWAGLYSESNKESTIGRLGYRIANEILPSMSNKPISLDGVDLPDAELNAIKDWLYYLLHPTEGFAYVTTLITNKVSHLLLGWHSDMVGTNGVGATTGTTRYRSHMGYVTMPDLSEVQWTNSLINFYNDCIPFLIVILIVIMIFAFITGILDLQHALLGILLFSIFTLLPVNLINAVVGQSNRISQNIYGDKFTYWALVQQESYSQAIDEAANADGSEGNSSYENYLRTLYLVNEEVYTNQGGESILLKWQAPKKMASLVLTQEDADSLNGLNDIGKQMLSGMLNKTYSGQSFLEDDNAVYMYRSYTDISNFSRYIYTGINGKGSKVLKYRKGFGGVNTDYWTSFNDKNGNLIKTSTDYANEYKRYIQDGYTYGSSFNTNTKWSDQFYLTVPLSSNIINDALKVRGKISNFKNSNDMIPINSDIFNFGIPMFTNPSVKFNANTFISTGMITDNNRKKDLTNYMNKYKSEEDYVGLAAYGLYSENPYYYFSWKLYSDGLDSKSSLSGSTGFKNLLLSGDNGSYFYNTSGNGGLKDFMNMKGLFTFIIPYMKQCNDLVREWDNTFGIFIYDGVPTEEGHWDEVKNNPELKQKYWHNLNVTRLYDLYCPWVDIMYDCSYSNAENITVMGKRVTVSDPLNPNSYPKDRPMIFSESEMSDYGLSEADLTQVEKLILKCNEQYQERLYELLNYYNFSDTTLNSAAAMNCAFVFNNTFSENGLFSENHNIYPQSFDLENFSYDAFLRFILSNSTGEDMLETMSEGGAGTSTGKTTGDFYEKIVNRSSIVTVIVMLILDVLSIYLIPAFRIFFLIAIFLVSVCIILVSAFKIEDSMKFVRKVGTQFFIPLMLFFVTTVAFSWLISLFMGVGNNDVTQTEGLSISMGDPVVTMMVMIALDLLLLFIYWKIIKQALQSIKHHAKLLKGFGTTLLGAGVGFVAGAVSSAISGVQNAGDRAYNGYRRHKTDKMHKKNSKSLETLSENSQKPAQEGTGVENSRASERGATGTSINNEDIPPIRDVDKDKRETGIDTGRDTAKESEAKREAIDDKAKSGADKLQDSFDEKRSKRNDKELKSYDKDYGYAKTDAGYIDESRLTSKDRDRYQRRRSKVDEREYDLKQKEREKVNKVREKEQARADKAREKENRQRKSEFKKQKKEDK